MSEAEDQQWKQPFRPILPRLNPWLLMFFWTACCIRLGISNIPQDVLVDVALDVQEKRAILSSWASDACAVGSVPALRMLPGAGEPVSFDAIRDALRQLDQKDELAGRDGSDSAEVAAFVPLVDRI
ncbi:MULTISPECIES: hypothetical protein [unclassified Mesorhizobium]|uniref:hypothetical protein n=1 Tax=unclassified Mesorhizobium TaxID=325217 RepID=UPI0029622816|nr:MULTISPECIES: hypothetical protein [unclassified Mesorhizobium]